MKIVVHRPKAFVVTPYRVMTYGLINCANNAHVSRGTFGDYDLPGAKNLLTKLTKKKPFPHASVLEHGFLSARVLCSRTGLQEIARHRNTTFGDEHTFGSGAPPGLTASSTRYIEQGDVIEFVLPPDAHADFFDAFDLEEAPPALRPLVDGVLLYRKAREESPRELARYALPGSLAVYLGVTATFRQWCQMIALRTDGAAAPEMRKIFGDVLEALDRVSPIFREYVARIKGE